MTAAALALLAASAVAHAAWNLLVKRAGPAAGGPAFAWLFSLVSAVLPTPVALWMLGGTAFTPTFALFLAGSAVLHSTAFRVLQRGYGAGDLSLVYPLSRGTGPLVASAVAVFVLGEPRSAAAMAGAGLVAAGAFVLTGGGRALREPGARRGAALGLVMGLFIAATALWDKQLVGRLRVPPLVLDWTLSLGMTALLAPGALGDRPAVRRVWAEHRRTVVVTAALSSLSYVLFLTALAAAPVSRVAPARELSIVVATLLGGRVLGEADAGRRLAGAAAITAGVVLLAAG